MADRRIRFRRDYKKMTARGVTFNETPREEPYGTVVVFQDIYGNKWDLLELKPKDQPSHHDRDH